MGYYMGDYMAGDPGLMGLAGGVFRRAGSALRRVLPHMPAAAGMAAGAITKVRRAMGPAAGRVIGAAAKHPVLSAAAAAGAVGAVGGLMAPHMAGPGAAPAMAGAPGMRGFHVSKRSGKVVRNRRMRVTNTKALYRSLRRVQGFARVAMKTIRLIHPRKRGRFGGFKPARRRKKA